MVVIDRRVMPLQSDGSDRQKADASQSDGSDRQKADASQSDGPPSL